MGEKWLMTIAVIGGTGKEGSGLALRWAKQGYRIVIGSRSAEKAQNAAAEMNDILGSDAVIGLGNAEAAEMADLVVLSVPYAAHKPTLVAIKDGVQGKVLVDVTVPMQPPKIMEVSVPEGIAAALEAQAYLGDNVTVISAFQNVSASKLKKLDQDVDCDVLVCGDDEQAKADCMQLVDAAGMRGIDAGPLVNAVAAEALTPVLLYINKKYGVRGAGIRITGVED